MLNIYKKSMLFLILFLIILISCSNPEKEFTKVQKRNTIEAYKKFIKKYPDCEFINKAKAELENLEYENAQKINTVNSFEIFLSKYPESKYKVEILNSIEKLEFAQTTAIDSIQTYETFLTKYPDSEFKNIIEEKIAYKKAIAKNTLVSFKEFIQKYPDGEFAVQVQKEIDKRQYNVILTLNYSDKNLSVPYEAQQYSNVLSVMRSAMHGNSSLVPISELINYYGHNIIWADSKKLIKYKKRIPDKYIWVHCKVVNDMQGPLSLELITPGTVTNWSNKKGSLQYSEREGSSGNDMARLLNSMNLPTFKLIERLSNFNFNSKEVQSYATSSNIYVSE